MDNIENYESVELETPEEKGIKSKWKGRFGKGKFKPNFILKKRHVALAALVLALSAAVYINYLYSTGGLGAVPAEGEAIETKNYGDSLLVSGEGDEVEVTDAAAYFSEARLTRQQSREEAVETLQNLYDSAEISESQLLELATQAAAIAGNIEAESKIENIVKAKGFEECIVYLSGEYADVIVQTEGLLSTEAAQIKEAILQETSVPVENISIIEVN